MIGRPPKKDPKNINLKLRINSETSEQLSGCAQALGISRTAVIEQGIRRVAEECGRDMRIKLYAVGGGLWEGSLRKRPQGKRKAE